MAYTNSSLVDCKRLSPNHSGQRTHRIDRITPHCVVGQLSAESIGDCFPQGRGASANYGIGYNGRVCLIVDEKNRSWCTSSADNDQRAITIEVASDKKEPYAFTDEAYNSLLELCVDICKRNDLKKVLWFGDKNKSLNYEAKSGECVLTVHRWFANKSCPGNWMYSRMGKLADGINAALNATGNVESNNSAAAKKDSSGCIYRVQCGAFKKKDNADKLLKQLKAKKIDAIVVKASGLYKVQVGAYILKQNALNQQKKIKGLGYDTIVAKVEIANESFTPSTSYKTKKSAKDIAKEIWEGRCSDSRWNTWGIGETRKERLKAAGYSYNEVQAQINKLYG